jgi:hypothetical protein
MPWVGFESTILDYEPSKTVHALDRAATVTGGKVNYCEEVNKNIGENITKNFVCFKDDFEFYSPVNIT